ncbi:TRAP transporter large permease [Microbaculum sp. FT89]|uniref:TRAP transporter large permease n=1 Tax=Microbaculum sp. FT89 TaxID=3447298 RepID=UPI003F52A399
MGSSVTIGVALGVTSILFILTDPMLDARTVAQSFFSFLGSFSLMTVPLFIYAGFLMERTGMVRQLFGFAEALVSRIVGGFGLATVATCVMFSAISGSSVAVASAMSLIAVPEMRARNYPDWLSAGIVSSGGGIGLLIPPSLSLIIYGIATETSIVRLFFAGIIPGLLLAVGMATLIVVVAWRTPSLTSGRFSGQRLRESTVAALPGLGMPILVLGGLYGGLFTPTESAAVACGYAMVYGLATRPREFLRELLPVTARAVNLTAVVFFLMGSVGVFQFVAANHAWPQKIAEAVVALDLGALPFLFGYLCVLLLLGMFLDGIAMILLTVPVVFPIATSVGVDPVHLGIVVTMGVELSVITPPVGFNLFAVSGIAKIPIQTVLRGAMIFFVSDLLVTVAIIVFPALSTWLPELLVSGSPFGG